jgi:uncharacterized protein YegL
MRKARIYFLVDTSRYMIGAPISKIEEIIKTFIREDCTDPHILEIRHYSIITFGNSEVKEYLPLTEASNVYGVPIQFTCSKERKFVESIDLLMKKLENVIVTPPYDSKGDYATGLFIFTGGLPEDQLSKEQISFLRTGFESIMGIDSKVNGTFLILFNNEYVRKWYSNFFKNEQIFDIENLIQIKKAYKYLYERLFKSISGHHWLL